MESMAASAASNVSLPSRKVPTVRSLYSFTKAPCSQPTRAKTLYSFSSSLSVAAPKPLISIKQNSLRCAPRPRATTRATISIGDKLPQVTLTHYDRNVVRTLRLSDVTFSRRVFIWVIPVDCAKDGAYDVGPLFRRAEQLKGTSYDAIIAVAVNGAWTPKQSLEAGDNVLMVGDEKGEFVTALGFPPDLKDKAKRPFDVVLELEGGFVEFLRYGRGYENLVFWKKS